MKPTFSFFLTISFSFFSFSLFAQDGAAIYKQNCAMCHQIGKGKLVGPDLKGSHAKFEAPWLIKWIKSSQSLVKAKDELAVKIFEENNKVVMPDQSLSDTEIESVIAYIKSETERLDMPAPAPSPEVASSSDAVAEDNSSGFISSTSLNYVLSGLVCVLLIAVIIMANLVNSLAKPNTVGVSDNNQYGA